MRQEGRKVPSKLTSTEWNRIHELKSISARRKYLSFLFTCEMKNVNRQKRKEEFKIKREQKLAEKREKAESEIVYGLGYNSFFLKIYETKINMWHNKKLINAMQFGQKLIIDCSYDEHMSYREADNCAKQLTYTFALNRLHNQPFDLHLCNFDENSKSAQKMINSIPTMFNLDFPINVHKQSYFELFNKERLVYLTPHCKHDLTEYNHDDIYIIGAMVDKANNEPISLAKAKKNNLRVAKLPLDRFLDWGKGGKSLTINQMLEILLEMKTTNDWQKALRFVPKRKLFKDMQQTQLFQEARQRRLVTIQKDFFDESKYEKSWDNTKKKILPQRNESYFNVNSWASAKIKKF